MITQIKICPTSSGLKFPYGHVQPEDAAFILANVGQVFAAERVNMNFYRLCHNNVHVHVYNGSEVNVATAPESLVRRLKALLDSNQLNEAHRSTICDTILRLGGTP